MTIDSAIDPGAPNRLRIAHVVLSLDVGGLERIVMHLARQFMVDGHEVFVICLEKPGSLASFAEAEGAKIIFLGKQPGVTPALVKRIRAVLREIQPDVVHTHQIGALLYAGWAARRQRISAVVHTEHSNHVAMCKSRSRRLRIRLLWWLAARYADYFFCVSKNVADAARSVVPKRKIKVIDNGIDTSVFDETDHRDLVRRQLNIPADALVIGNVARLHEVKCLDLLIRAFGDVHAERPAAHLLLVGDGPCKESLERLAAEIKLKPMVHFAGYQAEPHRYMQAMDIFALTSRLEGMPLAILEAWAARLPVVASRVGGIPGLVDDGTSGLLFDSGDQEALKRQLLRLASDCRLASSLGAAGRKRVEADFDMRQMAANYMSHYLSLLKQSSPAFA
jgi:glycosyltransferase involved in cell wall biosynthesis